ASHLPAFVRSLIEQNYSVVCVRAKAWRAVAFDDWLARRDVELIDVGDELIDLFHRRSYLRRSDCRSEPHRHESTDLRHLLRYLRAHDLCAPAPKRSWPADAIVDAFERFLIRDRGLAASTVRGYCATARGFLVDRFGDQGVDLAVIDASDVQRLVGRHARRLRPRALKQVVSALRAFIRYGEYCGDVGSLLIGAIPAVAVWTTTPQLPRAISPEHAQRAIASCDRGGPVGCRDRAILLMLARLGLRSGEVLELMLDDVDWDAGHIRVRGKNGHACLMPLPADVGQAITAYLEHGRPATLDRHLFVRTRAPFTGLRHDSDGVGSIVRNALRRAGVDAPHRGSHQFRHALAVRMLKEGASIPEIGELLRHRSPVATSVYARVDLVALRALALPWPGSVA
ncbi:MAG: site-specific integrase, partial [Burkholderiales bacterium]